MLCMTMAHCKAMPLSISEAPDLPGEFAEQTKTQSKLPDSELRILHQSEGKLSKIHFDIDLNRPVNHTSDFLGHCKQLPSILQVLELCCQIWPLCYNFKQQEIKHQHTI